MILEEFDESLTSTFSPLDVTDKIEGFPKLGITCFSKKLLDALLEMFEYEEISDLANANGHIPVYKINYRGEDIALYMSYVGASPCCVAYETMLAKGLEKLVMFGTCGVLDESIEDLGIIIPTSAIRGEGVSYHYMEPSKEVLVNEKYKNEFIDILKEHDISYVEGKTWTTDAPFRETKDMIAARKKMGAICVDMEASAINAVANFRDKEVFQFFYAADNLSSSSWNQRSLSNSARLDEKKQIGLLALEMVLKMK